MGWQDRVLQARAALGIAHGHRAFGPPLQISLSLTNRCNVRCVHCWYHSARLERPNLFAVRRARLSGEPAPNAASLLDALRQDADADKTASLIDEAARMGVRLIQFDANGEVFLHPAALDLMARAKAAGRRSVTYTNGTLLSADNVDALVEMGFDDICVTTLAGTAEDYRRTHSGAGGETFARVSAGLLYLAERKRSRGVRRPRLRMNYTVIDGTVDGLPDFARFARDVEAEHVSFMPLDDIGDPSLAELRPAPEEAAQAKAALREAARFLDDAGIGHNVSASPAVLWRQRDTSALYRSIPCYYGWLGMKIDLDGSVCACCRCYEPLGNAHLQGLAAIWHSESYRRFRRQALDIVRRGTPVAGCQCYSCSQALANLRVYRALHPVRSRRLHPEHVAENAG